MFPCDGKCTVSIGTNIMYRKVTLEGHPTHMNTYETGSQQHTNIYWKLQSAAQLMQRSTTYTYRVTFTHIHSTELHLTGAVHSDSRSVEALQLTDQNLGLSSFKHLLLHNVRLFFCI